MTIYKKKHSAGLMIADRKRSTLQTNNLQIGKTSLKIKTQFVGHPDDFTNLEKKIATFIDPFTSLHIPLTENGPIPPFRLDATTRDIQGNEEDKKAWRFPRDP